MPHIQAPPQKTGTSRARDVLCVDLSVVLIINFNTCTHAVVLSTTWLLLYFWMPSRLQIGTGKLFHCYLASWSAKQCSFHPTPRSAQTTLGTFVLATFTVLATIHYDRKKYTEPTAVHWGLQRLLADTVTNIQCWECRQGECLKRGLNKTSWQCETWHWSRSYTWNITPESWVELDIIYIYIYIIIMKQPFSSL